MDNLKQQIEHLTQRIRRLESESLHMGFSSDIRAMMDEMDLIPICEPHTKALTKEAVEEILRDLGYDCHRGEDFIGIYIDENEGHIQLNTGTLPMISITNGFLFDETGEDVQSIRDAAYEITGSWDMVKAMVDPSEGHLLIYLNARHEDVASFRKNIKYYIDQVIGASRELRERYNCYERNRLLAGFKTKTTKSIPS